MLTIALDESSGFEGIEEHPATPVFIAGLVYNDMGSEEDAKNERLRVTEYLKAVCKNTRTIYPRDLHYSKAFNNGGAVKDVKAEMDISMPEFFQCGTYMGNPLIDAPRHGKYHLFAMLKSMHGKQINLTGTTSNLLEAEYASNLYTGMAYDIISRLVFYNPIISDIENVKLELPTRAVPLKDVDEAEFVQLGYTPKVSRTNFHYIPIISADGYRSAIQREMLEAGKTNIRVEGLDVKSIQYNLDANDDMSMTYLYLADAICAFLSFRLRGVAATWEDSFSELFRKLSKSNENLVFSYDSVDTYFSRAWKALEAGNYFEALSLVFDAEACTSECYAFYKKYWFSLIEDKIVSNGNTYLFEEAVLKLRALALSSNLHQGKLLYIFHILERAVQSNKENEDFNKSAIYSLYDTGLSAFNHIANTEEAERCFQLCRENAEYANIEYYLSTLNKRTVQLMDSLHYEQAKEIADETVAYEEELLAIKQMVYGSDGAHSLSFGRSLSQSGQVYAALQDAKAEKLFLQALNHFPNGSADYYITLSYFLHFCISMNRKDCYEAYILKYFDGRSDIEDQFQYMLIEGKKGKDARITLKFALFLFIKGIYSFYMGNLNQAIKNKLFAIEKTLKKAGLEGEINGHPWELIFKYLAFIAWKNQKTNIANQYIELTDSKKLFKSSRGHLLDNIVLYGIAQYDDLTGNAERCAERERTIWGEMGNDVNAPIETIHAELKKKFTFMYV